MNNFDRKFTVTKEMIEAYEDLIGEKNKVNRTVNRVDGSEIRKVPNGLVDALIHDTVWRTLGDGAVVVSKNITHIRPIPADSEIGFTLSLITGAKSIAHYMILVGASESSYNVIGNLTVKIFKLETQKNDDSV